MMFLKSRFYLILPGLLLPFLCLAQDAGSIFGSVVDKASQKPLNGVTVGIAGVKQTVSDSLGRFSISGLLPASYSVSASSVNYITLNKYNVILTAGNQTELNFELEAQANLLDNVVINTSNRKSAKAATLETPLSVQRMTTEEIKANPGGNFDISKVIQSLPGVGGGVAGGGFRNDILIRGGAPNENVFYLDGIELPTINHFATQGAGGGPQGILNVSFIEDVKLSSSAFDARFDNALSSVFEFKQKKGNANKVQGNVRLSATELATTLEGPLSKGKQPTTFLASVRRSYLQLLFSALDLPIRPNYWDAQFKTNTQLNARTTLTLLGVGALDRFNFAAPKEATPEKLYSISSNPAIQQNSYTIGAAIRHLIPNGYWNLALSRNWLDNQLDRYSNNLAPSENTRNLRIRSIEAENKIRFDVTKNLHGFRLAYGITAQWVEFSNNSFAKISESPVVINAFNSSIQFAKFGLFVQAGKRLFNNRLGLSMGLRSDVNTFTSDGMNAASTLSPRFSINYVLADQWNLNASVGRYAKIPTYAILGFRDNAGQLVNKSSRYTISNHYVAGIEHLKGSTLRFTLEGFYKTYQNVPVSIQKGISLANLGSDFNVLGNEAVTSTGSGRAYGLEFFAQKKLTNRFFGIFSYTFYKSEYTNRNNQYVPSAWDNRHLISMTLGYKLPRNWELGLKFRYQGGAPYTLYNEAASRANYLSLGEGVLDYATLNQQRLQAFNASDIRIDKKWNLKKVSIDLFLDITNWYAAKSYAPASYTFKRNDANTAFVTTDGAPLQANGSNAIPFLLNNNEGNLLPTLGFIVEF